LLDAKLNVGEAATCLTSPPKAFGADPPSRATRIARGISGGQKKFKEKSKKVLRLFSGLDTSAGNPRKFEAKKGQKKSKKSLAFIFQS